MIIKHYTVKFNILIFIQLKQWLNTIQSWNKILAILMIKQLINQVFFKDIIDYISFQSEGLIKIDD